MVRNPFDEYFKRMMKRFFKDFEELEKEFGLFERRREELPEFVVRKPGRVERRGGFSISIFSDGRNPPKVEMRRFSPSGKWEKVPLMEEKVTPVKPPEEKPALPEVREKVIPEYNVSVDVKDVTITLNAEGVESEKNVKIKFYPESVEIYATSPKLRRGYFCTVAVPASVNRDGTAVEVKPDQVIIKIPRRFSAT